MKIAQVICTFPPYKGGMGNVAYQFSNDLTKHGHDVTIFTPKYSEQIEDNQHEFKVVQIQPFLKFGNAAILNKIVKQLQNFDIIHLHYPFFGTAYFIYKFKKLVPYRDTGTKKKLIITYHMDAISDGIKGLFFKLYANILMPKILKAADIITVSSIDYIKNSAAKQIFEKYPDKFIELPFGVDLERFKPQEKNQDLMNKFGIQLTDKVILFVGGLDLAHYFKGVDILIEAIKRCQTPYRVSDTLSISIKAIIVGEGELKNYYQNLVKKNNLENVIKFARVEENEELVKYYNLCDLFILPSINSAEAFGLVLLEAMACGKAVLASNLPGVRTVPVDKQNCVFNVGDVKDLSDKIYALLSNDKLRLRIGEEGKRKVEEKYNWDKIISQLEKVYLS